MDLNDQQLTEYSNISKYISSKWI